MRFSDKLYFLMNITQTSNKQLAKELGVDRSLISMMRSGSRNLPRNPATVRNMALYFAKNCSAEYQRFALSEILGQVSLRSAMPVELLADQIEKWFRGDTDIVGEIVEGIRPIQEPPQPAPSQPAPQAAPLTVSDADTSFYYGEAGRRQVVERATEIMQNMENPCSVLIVTDDNLEWLLSDYLLSNLLQTRLIELAQRGFRFVQIMPAVNYMPRYTESLRFWLPIYATGQVEVYYYPRLRDNLYRHSIIVIPERCVQYSSAVGPGSTSDIVMLSTNPKLVKAFTKQFHDHLSLCRPALVVRRNIDEFFPCFRDILSREGNTIQMVTPLSINTMPKALLERCIQETDHPQWRSTFQMYLDELPHFEDQLKQGAFIDMAYLSTAEAVRSGAVFIGSAHYTQSPAPRYTPETYVMHLENILRLMDQYEDYHFLPLCPAESLGYNLIVNEDGLALLIRTTNPVLMLEIRRPEMVMACQEHLFRKADSFGFSSVQREKVRRELRALIRELQD